MTHNATDAPGGHGDQTSGQFSVEPPGLNVTSTSQGAGRPEAAGVPHANVDVAPLEGQPASPDNRTINAPARVITDQSVAGQQDTADPGPKAMPRQRVTAEVIAAQPAVDPGMARPEVPDLLADSVSDPTPLRRCRIIRWRKTSFMDRGLGQGRSATPNIGSRQNIPYGPCRHPCSRSHPRHATRCLGSLSGRIRPGRPPRCGSARSMYWWKTRRLPSRSRASAAAGPRLPTHSA